MTYDIIIAGAGIVGLATAYQTLKTNPNKRILILEKETSFAKHQTGNNSGVIHSGLYYKPDSLKAKNCIRGYKMLLDFCDENQINYDLCGKIVVATKNEEIPALDILYKRAKENGLENIKLLTPSQIKEYEPHVNGVKGFHVPQTGIINYKEVCQKLVEVLEKQGTDIHFSEAVLDINTKEKEVLVSSKSETYHSKVFVNCAGLYSDKLADLTGIKTDLKILPFRGEYYKLKPEKEHLVKNLIYPVPDPNFPFLGVHFTRMINGGIEAGPNAVLAFGRESYKKSNINLKELSETLLWPGFHKVASKYWKTGMGEMYRSFSKKAFAKALQALIPEITENDLVDGGAGIRAQACDRNGKLIDDFLILENKNIVNICNAPSPAATSSLSIGQSISEIILAKLD